MALHVRALLAAALTLPAATAAYGAEPPAGPDAAARVVPPTVKNAVEIEYPEALADDPAPPEGGVVVRFVVGEDGVPRDIAVVSGIHPDLDALASDAVSRLRFEPATLDGKAVAVALTETINFEAPEPAPEPVAEDPSVAPDEPTPTQEPPTDDAGPVRINGKVVEAGQRGAVPNARIVVVPAPPDAKVGRVKRKTYVTEGEPEWSVSIDADEAGAFTVRGTPDGRVRVIVLAPGFERFESVEALAADQAISVKYYLQRLPNNPYRTVVRAPPEREEVARRQITVEEINNLPGTQGDALKAVQNFPGIARSPFSIGLLAIRGTGPNDSAVFLGHHEIPTLFHFGGLTSVFNSDIIERIDYVPGNYDSRYGDAIGGIIDVTPKAGRRDGFHGYIDSDIFDTGVLIQGPVGKGSYALSGRRSYIDFILPLVIPDDAGLDFTLAPRYYDYQGLFNYPVGEGEFKLRLFGSDDRTILTAADQNDVETDDRNRFETTQFFHRADVEYTRKEAGWDFLVTPSYRLEFLQFGIGDIFDFDLRTHNLSFRAEVGRRLSRRTYFKFGTEFINTWFQVDVDAPPLPDSNDGSTGDRLQTNIDGIAVRPAVYSSVRFKPVPRFAIEPGVRVTVYGNLYDTATVDPRLRTSVKIADRTKLKGGTGIYSQAPQPVEASDVFGNPRIGPEFAWQNSIGIEQEFNYGITLDATTFYNVLWNLSTASLDLTRQPDGDVSAENFSNTGRGRVYGLEILLRKQLTGSVFGWVAYTLSRSERREPGEEFALFDFDQTHILTLIGVYRFPKNWQVGARFRLVSGNPNTPVAGATYDASGGFYTPINGAINSDRFPVFHQLDLRVDKRWIWRLVSLSLYLDVQNVYNAQNVEFWNYSFDFTERTPIMSLPIIPSIGSKFEW